MNHRDSERDSAMGERLSRYLDGELDPAETRQVERLLETSVEAREMYEMLQEVHALSAKMMPRSYFPRPTISASRRWLLTRLAAALVLAAVLGGLSYAAVQVYVAYVAESGPNQQTSQPAPDSNALIPAPASPAAPQQPGVPDDRYAAAPSATPSIVTQAAAGVVDGDAAPLTGIVQDADGNALAGAEVRAVGWSQQALDLCQDRQAILARARTDASGRFTMDWPPDAWLLKVAARGYIGVEALYTGELRGASVELQAGLRPAPVVSGRVTDEEGQPVPSVRVIPMDALDPVQDTVLTDDDGAFSIAMDGSTLLFQHAGFAIGIVEAASADTPLNVTLNRGGRVVVRVVRAGIPVPGAVVTSNAPLPPAVDYDVTRIADENGQATYELVPAPLFYELVARSADGDAAMKEISVLPGQTATCILELPQRYPGLVQGAVIDAQGQPVSGARVMIGSAGDGDIPDRMVLTDVNGAFAAGLDYGDMRIYVERSGAFEEEVDGESARRIEITPERTSFYEEFRYKPAERMVITLKDSAGQPVTAAEMMISRVLETPSVARHSLLFRVTSDDGQFLAPRHGRLKAWAYQPENRRAGSASSEEPVDELEIVLDDPTGAIAVRVTDTDGQELEDVLVAASRDIDSELLRYGRGYTNGDGLVALDPLGDGLDYRLFARADGYQLPSDETFPSVAASVEPDPVHIALAPMSSGLAGRVAAMDGTPAVGADVTIVDDSGRLVSAAKSDDRGEFTVEVASGAYAVHAYARPFLLSEQITVTAPAQGIQLVLPVDTMPEREVAEGPNDPENIRAQNNLKHMGLVFKMFANEAQGTKFPPVEPSQGVFLPEWKAIYPEYLTDKAVLFGNEEVSLCYLGYAVVNEDNGLAFLDAYEALGADGIYDHDIQVQAGKGTAGTDTLYQLNERIGQVFFGDASPGYGGVQADIPVMWEVAGDRPEPGGWVIYMDGHVEWMPYPGPFPMTEAFTNRLRATMGLEPIAAP